MKKFLYANEILSITTRELRACNLHFQRKEYKNYKTVEKLSTLKVHILKQPVFIKKKVFFCITIHNP